jgi:DNA-binding transcriptional regulator PaaX
VLPGEAPDKQIVWRDPFLPAPLLPKDYRGKEAWTARLEAFRYFSRAIGGNEEVAVF